MLTLSDKDGVVEGSIPGLADAARISIEECEYGLSRLMSPDKYSRTKDFDGKRVGEIEGGWVILNYSKYREPTSKERTAKWRKKRNTDKLQPDCVDVTSHAVTQRHTASPVSPSASVSVSSSSSESFSLNPEEDKDKHVVKKIKKQKAPFVADPLTKKYLYIFNAVFKRNFRDEILIQKKIKRRLSNGTEEWRILCAPILQAAMDHDTQNIRNFNPEMLLRDGKKSRTGEGGVTYGATDWLERIYLVADTLHLNEYQLSIAKHFELTEYIEKTGCKI